MLIIAHRGAWAETALPEQTRASFEAAFALGTDGVECDVRLTADGEVVCHHDATAERLTGVRVAISEATLAELRSLDWDATTPGAASGGILTLAELIEICRDAARPVVLAIELKHPNPAGVDLDAAVIRVLADAGWNAGDATLGSVRVSLMSFNPESLGVLLRVVSAEHVTLLTTEAGIDDIAYAIDTADADAAARAALEARLSAALAAARDLIEAGAVGGVGPDIDTVRATPAAVRRWIDAGRTVRVWTVDEREDAALCAGLGVQQIETDRPRDLLAWRDAPETMEP